MQELLTLDIAEAPALVRALLAAWGLKALASVVVLLVGVAVARVAGRSARTSLVRARMDPTLVPFLSGLVSSGLLLFVALAVLGILGVPTTSFIAVVGAAGLAIALAFQGTLSNFAAGIVLLMLRPFKVGDVIEAGSHIGKVSEVGIFFCALTTGDNIRITIPNAKLLNDVVRNYTTAGTRRLDLVVGVSYGDDLDVAIRAIRDVLAAEERLLPEPEAVVGVSEMGESSVNLVVRPWVAASDYWPARFALIKALKEGLERAGCTIPFPQRDVHLFPSPEIAA